ncbi:Acyl-CoA-binding domain-containing protein 5 [Tetrabaena socialis]|uniref:Acyl-CoA-binding domain-containing protein 5 n=1 Tax=Tetrabaena socialis TaxID=47790 RepID=A0A2J8A491_9CHLO|nr:Acyl-CoA-binding domain-containing protein 5 [Tetrabaena socialis]|eukprot:PNH07325.1 Acyl-CoA-binding domain-containing protein 5 [Tetrabaena socialis]
MLALSDPARRNARPRFAMCALPDGSGRLLLHTHRCAEDVLLLETAAQPQARLSKAAVRGSAAGSPSPPSRGLHTLTVAAAPPDESGGNPCRTALYLYGGAPQSGPMFGDLWVLDVDSMTWRQLQPEGPAPHARCSHTAAAAGGASASSSASPAGGAGRYLVVAGGSYYTEPGRLQPLADVAVYDTQANRWVEAAVEGPLPSPRNAAILAPLRSTVDGGSRFVLHGGWWPFVETYNDTYILTVKEAA